MSRAKNGRYLSFLLPAVLELCEVIDVQRSGLLVYRKTIQSRTITSTISMLIHSERLILSLPAFAARDDTIVQAIAVAKPFDLAIVHQKLMGGRPPLPFFLL